MTLRVLNFSVATLCASNSHGTVVTGRHQAVRVVVKSPCDGVVAQNVRVEIFVRADS